MVGLASSVLVSGLLKRRCFGNWGDEFSSGASHFRPDSVTNFRPLVQEYLDVMIGTNFASSSRSLFCPFGPNISAGSLLSFTDVDDKITNLFHRADGLQSIYNTTTGRCDINMPIICCCRNMTLFDWELDRTWKNNHARHSIGTRRTKRFI